jgi:sigma-B regulation protein RsbU (phosphoserine phosphatase)
MHGLLPWLITVLYQLLPVILGLLLFISYKRYSKLRNERNRLLQEKEAAMGFVNNVGQGFSDSETVEMDALLERVLYHSVRTCKAASGCIHLVDSKTKTLHARSISGVFPPPFSIDINPHDLEHNATERLNRLILSTPIPLGKGIIGEAAVLGHSLLVEDGEMDSRIPPMPVSFLNIRTMLVVPMRFGNRTIGVLTLVNRTNNNSFAPSDLNLAQALATHASIPIHYANLQTILEEKRQLDHDMQIAQQIQNSLLPRQLPSYSSVDLAGFNHPAMDIGGDYYDFIHIDEKHIGLAIADVSGKGIGGALMMAVCRSVLRENAQNVYDPSSMLSSLNQTLSSNLADDMFISILYMVLNLETHLLSYARAGHEAPIIIRNGDRQAEQIETAGIAIGLVDSETFGHVIETRTLSLRPGDMVVTYTDGVTEAMNSNHEEWGKEKLLHSIENMTDSPVKDLLESIRNDVISFTGANRQHDDMTMLALKIK